MKYILFCFGFFLWPKLLLCQYFPVLEFQKFYDNTGDDSPERMIKSHDGNLIIGGNTLVEQNESCRNIWIIKVDTLGNLLWEQEITLKGCEELRDMICTPKGDLLFTGVSSSMIQHEERGGEEYWGDFFVGKLDSVGRIIWMKSMGGSRLDQAYGISKAQFDEAMIVGGTHSNDGDVRGNHGMSDVWSLKVDMQGKVQMNETLGGKNNDWATSITTCMNGDYLIAGMTNSRELGESKLGDYGNGLLIRMTPGGYIAWTRTFPCPSGGYLSKVREMKDTRIVVGGNYYSLDYGQEMWWMRLTAQGRLISNKIMQEHSDQWMKGITVCSDNGLLIGGYSEPQQVGGSYTKGGEDFWLVRTDGKGNIRWRDTYGGPDHERCNDVLEYRPGIFYAVGEKTNDFEKGSGNKDFWLLRVKELPADSIQASIFVRAPEYHVDRDTPTRFRARYKYGDRFFWDFGDGTTSTEENPLKRFKLPGVYLISLTVYTNESCKQTVFLDQDLEVW